MNLTRRHLLTIGLAAPILAITPSHSVHAQDVDFSGQTIDLIIPFGAGGSTDTWGRFFQPYLEKYLPGKPRVLPRNMPGMASITAGNWFESNAQPDGLTVFGASGSTHLVYLLRDTRVEFDMAEWIPILVSPGGAVNFVRPELGVKSFDDIDKLKGQTLRFPSQGPATLDLGGKMAYDLLGWTVSPIFGTKGRGEARLAFMRGEANIDFQSTTAYLRHVVPLVEEGQAVPLFSMGVIDADGNMQRDPTFPDIPSFAEAYEKVHGKPPSGTEWDAYRAIVSAGWAAQKILFLPKGTAPEIVEAWTRAVEKALADDELRQRAEDELGAYDQHVGAAAVAITNTAVRVQPEVREWILSYLADRYDYRP